MKRSTKLLFASAILTLVIGIIVGTSHHLRAKDRPPTDKEIEMALAAETFVYLVMSGKGKAAYEMLTAAGKEAWPDFIKGVKKANPEQRAGILACLTKKISYMDRPSRKKPNYVFLIGYKITVKEELGEYRILTHVDQACLIGILHPDYESHPEPD